MLPGGTVAGGSYPAGRLVPCPMHEQGSIFISTRASHTCDCILQSRQVVFTARFLLDMMVRHLAVMSSFSRGFDFAFDSWGGVSSQVR